MPCGIFDDKARISQLLEDATTVRKAQHQINHLATANDALSLNQATRWVMTKEEHAGKIIPVVSEYFMTQKMKAIPAKGSDGYPAYLEKLAVHHAVLVAAMKAKQNVDEKTAEALVAAIQVLQAHYE